ncbi:hypothetical protein AMATHDRAFT_149885 [Amanita thiersii Skay4041]|uniref:Phytocyanin domain-containing protein n=1 Tax=Amanita thiersii Skay4041 TaxID=703135 RepID=A0A2A9NBQ1_9AGAR|nr:hypothetical protein AMATHDRAFT_149885 [Amanita thiersii Skay4041]
MLYSAAVFALASLIPAAIADGGRTTFDVHVGPNDQLVYVPPFTNNAQTGNVINFVFHPKNHTVTQTTFNDPCVFKPDGFNSGYVPVARDERNLPTYQITITDNNPVYVYCKQGDHCIDGKRLLLRISRIVVHLSLLFTQEWCLL